MKGYRLSPQAEQTLTEIIGWTVDQFGIDQAIKYKDQLTARLSALASGQNAAARYTGHAARYIGHAARYIGHAARSRSIQEIAVE